MNHSAAHVIVFEWPLLASEVVVFGLAAFVVIVNAPAGGAAVAVRNRILSLLRYVALAAFIWAPLDLMHRAAEMAAVSTMEAVPILPEVLSGTHAGRIWIARTVALAALVAVTWMRRPSRAKAIVVASVAAILLLLRALASHAINVGATATALYLVHELFAGVWLGSLLGIWTGYRVAGAPDADAWFVMTAPRVSRAAGGSLALLAATGLYAAYDGIGPHLGNLVYSAYGRTLILKLAIAALAVLIGGYNRFRLVPALDDVAAQAALRGNVAAEVVVLAVVLACSVVLAATPPAH
jgi:putative copper resistance protein D